MYISQFEVLCKRDRLENFPLQMCQQYLCVKHFSFLSALGHAATLGTNLGMVCGDAPHVDKALSFEVEVSIVSLAPVVSEYSDVYRAQNFTAKIL